MTTEDKLKEGIIKKFELISEKYHRMSLLFYELSQSLRIVAKNKNYKEFREYLKSLNLDVNKIKNITKVQQEISLGDLQK